MFGVTGRTWPGRFVGRVPVVDGPQNVVPPAQHEQIVPAAPCSACGYGDRNGVIRRVVIRDGVRMSLCVDWQACTGRWRGGVSPGTYAAGLRGEILAVAP